MVDSCPFGIPTYVELVEVLSEHARMRQDDIKHALDNDGGDETMNWRQRNGLDTCPISSMLKQMLVSWPKSKCTLMNMLRVQLY